MMDQRIGKPHYIVRINFEGDDLYVGPFGGVMYSVETACKFKIKGAAKAAVKSIDFVDLRAQGAMFFLETVDSVVTASEWI